MRFLHISDLHLGKRLNGVSLIDDQRFIMNQIAEKIKSLQTEAVIIAGDVYDKPVPPAEAVTVLDEFLTAAANEGCKVFMINGNHDSAERVSFGNELLSHAGVHIAPLFSGSVEPVEIEDEFGPVNVYLLPFIRPSNVRAFFPDEEIEDYTQAMSVVINNMKIDESSRNILVSHQFVTGSVRSESEEVIVGQLENIDASVYKAFDYVALGHIHKAQTAGGSERIRYCGAPLKYSFGESEHEKSVTLVEFNEKGNVAVSAERLEPLHDMRKLKASYMEASSLDMRKTGKEDDFLQVILTDEEDVPDAMAKLRIIYPNILSLEYDNRRTQKSQSVIFEKTAEIKSPQELFSELYRQQNNQEITAMQEKILGRLIDEIWKENA